MPVGTPKYITAAEVKAKTSITGLQNLSDSAVDSLIVRAEDRIDAYFGERPHHEDDADTHRVFPRKIIDQDDDGNPIIPYEVESSTFYTVEMIYLDGNPQSAEDFKGGFESENISAGGYSYKKASRRDAANELLPVESKMLLDKLLRQSYQLSVL